MNIEVLTNNANYINLVPKDLQQHCFHTPNTRYSFDTSPPLPPTTFLSVNPGADSDLSFNDDDDDDDS